MLEINTGGKKAMYLKSIHNVNVGPIKDAKIIFPFNEDKLPKPVVIVGENGTGKSVLLSNVVDSFHEIARLAFDDVVEKSDFNGYQYYKAVLGQEIRIGEKFMYSYLQYEDGDVATRFFEYLFKCGEFSFKKFCDNEGIKRENCRFQESRSDKQLTFTEKDVEIIFGKNIVCYFPPSRYEKPNWLGARYYDSENSSKFEHPSIRENISRRLGISISVEDVTNDTLQWLLDVIVDAKFSLDVQENGGVKVYQPNNEIFAIPVTKEAIGNSIISVTAKSNLELIMSQIIGQKICFGLNLRNANKSRFHIRSVDDGKILIPSLDALSTGQSALFNIFATIIRYADRISITNGIDLQNITGIVVIDEAELHLHSNLQRDVLPRLLKLFPKVQFIISSHSPLFLLGMDKVYDRDGYEIYEMPSARIITAEKFSEFGKAYEYLTKTETHQQKIREAIQNHIGKPLIITEGSTDWKHMKAAFENLKTKPQYENYANLDFEFLEYEPGELASKENVSEKATYLKMGKDVLKQMCREFAKLQQSRKIIFIADRDDEKINKEFSEKDRLFKNHGNNVFSFVLPVPEHRASTPNICIEHFYKDYEIKTPVEINGIKRRIYLGNEFTNDGISLDGKLFCRDRNSCGDGKINIIDGNDEKSVYAINDPDKINLALPKMEFAKRILGHSPEFASFDFDSFRLIFDVIKQILDNPDV